MKGLHLITFVQRQHISDKARYSKELLDNPGETLAGRLLDYIENEDEYYGHPAVVSCIYVGDTDKETLEILADEISYTV